ncbi:MAG: PTS sugar transporter subunit IIC, partial [Alistipes sp.]|nr:PTS sugar transporter subunit IIC [Alistipes sp.]
MAKKSNNKNAESSGIKSWFKTYVVDALSYMAMGLFASLIIGLIIKQIALIPGLDFLAPIATIAQLNLVVGGAIGLAIALGLKRDPLVTISAVAVGALGYTLGGPVGDVVGNPIGAYLATVGINPNGAYLATVAGNPIGAYLATIVAIEIGSLVSKRTPVDIILTPLVTIIIGGLVAQYICVPIGEWVMSLGELINRATELNPFAMGVIVAVSVGCILTLPISSAALCISIGISGLAAGAATAGCCAQMVGFAVISFKENGWGGLISQGLGTSMLQIGNIARKPIVWLAPTLASAILGPISTCILHMKNNAAGAGMGTSGLVGPIGCWDTMSVTTDHAL